jgi:iron(III) transport system substrate-binding protein
MTVVHQEGIMRLRHTLLAATLGLLALPAAAQQQVNDICPMAADWCIMAATEFEKATGIKVGLTLKGSGESYATVAAEKANPKHDIWYGGTGDPHLQAAEQDLTIPYKSPLFDQLQPWAKRQAEQSGFKTVGLYLGVLGVGYNTELLAKKKAPAPACWKDLARPEYAGDVQRATPNASGTAYTTIATLVQVFGEDEAFKMLKAWHKNISNYSRQGVGPIKATARGENLIAVAFIHDVVTEAQAGFPVKVVAPCEGTGYEIGSMSIIKGARNLDNAKKFYDWALTPPAQKLSYESKSSFQLPSNVGTPVSPLSPRPADIKLVDYNFAKYGSSAERKRLLEKWDKEVGGASK